MKINIKEMAAQGVFLIILNACFALILSLVFIVFGNHTFVQKLRQILKISSSVLTSKVNNTTLYLFLQPRETDTVQKNYILQLAKNGSSSIVIDSLTLQTNQLLSTKDITLKNTNGLIIFPTSIEFVSENIFQVNFKISDWYLDNKTTINVEIANTAAEVLKAAVTTKNESITALKGIYIVNNNALKQLEQNDSCSNIAQKMHFIMLQTNDTLLISSGVYQINETAIIPKGCNLTIEPNTTLKFSPGTSLISYSAIRASGTNNQPILLTSQSPHLSWGTLGILSTKDNKSYFSNVIIENGKDTLYGNLFLSGALSVYNSTIQIVSSTFRNNLGDDGLNAKNSRVIVKDSQFYNNDFDGIDLDYSDGSQIINSKFTNNGNDNLDISFSDVLLQSNMFSGSGDKCISIGEESNPLVQQNVISACPVGIAVKDSSNVQMNKNIFYANKLDIFAYNKKGLYSGGIASGIDNVFTSGNAIIEADSLSKVNMK